MNVFWYEVNEAWSEASLVWLWSFIKACKRSDSRIDGSALTGVKLLR